MIEILYEDNHLIAVNKPAGLLVQGDSTGDETLLDLTKKLIKHRDNKPNQVFLGLIHRIDRPTSGLIVFAKTSKALKRMNEIFKQRMVQKIYWAIVENQPPKQNDKLIHFLKKNQKTNKVTVYKNETKDAKKAISSYQHLKKLKNYHLLKIEIFTGRSHQIRTQLSFIGCPIKGDLKYGASRSNRNKGISLHARELSFIHPVKKEKITITAPPPKEPIWNDCL